MHNAQRILTALTVMRGSGLEGRFGTLAAVLQSRLPGVQGIAFVPTVTLLNVHEVPGVQVFDWAAAIA
jgi:hypothetical protein